MLSRKRRMSPLTILKAVAEEYTPTRFKTRFLEVFEDGTAHHSHEEDSEEDWSTMPATMEWDPAAQEMLAVVPAEFKSKAVQGTEAYAKKHNYSRITAGVVEHYRKELGF